MFLEIGHFKNPTVLKHFQQIESFFYHEKGTEFVLEVTPFNHWL